MQTSDGGHDLRFVFFFFQMPLQGITKVVVHTWKAMVFDDAANVCGLICQEDSAVLNFERLSAIDLNTIGRPRGPGTRGETFNIIISFQTESLVAFESGSTANTQSCQNHCRIGWLD